MTARRIQRNPDKRKPGTSIERDTHDLVGRQILALVPRTAPGITWTELRGAAQRRLGKKLKRGNNGWYTSVKLHLGASGAIERGPGSPKRLTRKT